ncbi:MAG: exodeoxyribonuclease VII small subunit [Candidatus Nanopelagicales bacterium]
MTDSGAEAPLTFEEARDELERIVRQLEEGSVTLQESLDLWERGEKLAAHCDLLLGQAESRIEAAKARTQEAT